MKNFLKTIFFYGFVIFASLNVISFLSLYSLRNSCFYKPEFLQNGVSQNKFNYLILGSSTGLMTLNTIQIDSISHKKGLNISLDDSSLSSHYLMLQHFYQLNKKTKTLILAVTPWDCGEKNPKINENDYRFLPYINQEYIYNYYVELQKSKINVLALTKYFPIIGVSYYNAELFFPSILAFVKPEKRNKFDQKGNFKYPNLGKPTNKEEHELNLVFNNPYLKKITTFCKTNKIKLIIYQSPLYKTKVVQTKANFEFINHSNLIKSANYFYDDIHVNEKGRKLCSTLVARYIQTQ